MSTNNRNPQATVDVIVVNYRTGTLVTQCLESLEADREDCPGLRVIVIATGIGSR